MSDPMQQGPADGGSPEEPSLAGQTLDGRYQVLSRLGEGGMGYVYEARHVQLGRPMVVKRLRPELVNNARTRERFLREAQTASRIAHPHVIAVKDFGVHPVYGAYYVMERLVGRDLAEAVLDQPPFEAARALDIAEQAAEALAAAHAASIVHRDLKPENIYLIERDGHPDFVKVLDFGLARVMDANRKLTETGQVIGTPRYMAPEQCRGERVDARADVYSLALILHEMLTGQQPYADLSTYEILGKKMFEDVLAPSQMQPPVTLPAPLEQLLMQCLARDPSQRPGDGASMAAALHSVRQRLGWPPGPFAHLSEAARASRPAPPPPSADDPRASARLGGHGAAAAMTPPPPASDPLRPDPLRPDPSRAAPWRPSFTPAAGGGPHGSTPPPSALDAPPPPRAAGRSSNALALVLGGLGVLGLLATALLFALVPGWAGSSASEAPASQAPASQAPASDSPPPEAAAAAAPLPDVREARPTRGAAAPGAAEERHHVQVISEPPGAEVLHEGSVLGRTPLRVELPTQVGDGDQVELRLEGYQPRRITLFVRVPRAHVQLHPG